MKQVKIIRAYNALSALSEKKLPLSISHKLWTLMKKLEPQWEFQSEKEQALISKFNPEVDEQGVVRFRSDEDEKNCKAEYAELMSEMAMLDVDWNENDKIVIHLDDQLDLSLDDISALCDFIEFVE